MNFQKHCETTHNTNITCTSVRNFGGDSISTHQHLDPDVKPHNPGTNMPKRNRHELATFSDSIRLIHHHDECAYHCMHIANTTGDAAAASVTGTTPRAKCNVTLIQQRWAGASTNRVS